jgi:hypothetical protein
MRTKNEFYSTLKEKRNMVPELPTFTPAINKDKRGAAEYYTKRVDIILEKGKEY